MKNMRNIVAKGIFYARKDGEGKEKNIVEDISMRLTASSFSLVTGKTGAGKSTLLHLLSGILLPTKGEILFTGNPVSRWQSSHRDRWRRNVGLVFQMTCLLSDITVLENVMAPMIPCERSMSKVIDRSLSMLKVLRLSHVRQKRIHQISGGEAQRVMIARALAKKPSYILADEPTAFQDDEMTQIILSLFLQSIEEGALLFVASHDRRIVNSEFIDQRMHLSKGRLVRSDAL